MKFTIHCKPHTKKNSMQLVGRGSRKIPIPSKNYIEFMKNAEKDLANLVETPIYVPINIKAIFYMESRRRVDLTNLLEALDDILVKYKVIEDDNRNIIASHNGSLVLWDKNNPRTEVEIELVENYEQWTSKK